MAKIINTTTGEVIYSNKDYTMCATVTNFLDNNTKTGTYIGIIVYEYLSDLIKTMEGDAVTPFNNIGEMIKYIPDILTAEEETAIIQLMELNQFFVLPYDYEDDANGWNKILQTVFPEYSVIDD
jgi:hypothetical protein